MSQLFKPAPADPGQAETMTAIEVLSEACSTISRVVRRAAAADLDQPTPCREFDLRALVNHFAGTTGALARLATRQRLDARDPWGSRSAAAAGDWVDVLTTNLQAVADGWSQPDAWQGSVDTGGHEMPAQTVGDMALIEVMLHGWDFARATGQDLEPSAAVGAEVVRAVEETAELGRQMEVYGPLVEVPPDAADFDRALGAAGRDRAWRA